MGAFVVLALGLSLAHTPGRLPRFFLGFAYRGALVDAHRWRQWVRTNPDFFGPLGETACFAIVESPSDSTGLIFTRERDGVTVEKTHSLLFKRIPLLLAMTPKTAEEFLLLDQRQGNRFWDGLKFLVQSRKLVVYPNAPREELDRVGLTGFLQVIDAIPPKT